MTEKEYISKVLETLHNSLDSKKDEEDKIEGIANIISMTVPDLRYCDCIAIVKKLIELDLIKGIEK